MKYSVSMIINKFDKKEILKYVFFYRNTPSSDGSITKTCFSQWWQGNFIVNEKEYCCMEQYMMAEKARLFNDKEIEEEIMECKYPKRIKALGRMVRNFNEDVWNDNKYDIVIGPVADDNMALLFRQYENEIIDFETLLKGMIYKKTSSQYSFHTEKSIRLLRKVDD